MKDGSAFLNDNAQRIIDGMIGDAERLRIGVSTGPLGECLIDAGAKAAGGVEAGLRMAEAAMGGLGSISVCMDRASPKWPFTIEVRSSQPVLACLGSQYAGWNLSSQDYFAMGSGPARALARVEPLFETLSYRDTASSAVLILETAKPPPQAIVEKVGRATGLPPEKLTFLYAPTQSLAGGVQIVARALEVALHKTNDLKFPLENVVDGIGTAPIPAPHPDFLTAMGRTNDAIIYGGSVQLFVKGSAKDASELAERLPSRASRDHGHPFAEVFKRFKGDFYAIDPLLFSPAEVIVTAIETGDTFRAGERDLQMLERSLG
ncbi:MAG: methenyltetrahydromethanopterin cyclohydrolase [Mesorhizobium sp.]|jgi:methenyltetrahydromethanopterin cyclohydrolase|uniref:methenyltetrahydromethanopterin cyclohydrolase n=1 Tax=Mesorhizobium sp. TaxID=1871066 RepID=UPI000FE3007E|nr:methenyltetrahydromethanopterin cyclohydrolase [Mesorhizobium sp.]RWO11142.1 MAG: methenyltetrahydromethanopterin cyclohydrolase [Mesorhizobium sp.]RWP16786.1 MAG: methenyltetrahydromethanopterin cyclohydrolase [Mesorhizobium sp.]RWP42950.1 MAG: methenyltetrahydromethanopterin cyclohydrolase [Mesorhizobium sp.]RWQ18488.1 MAG: methenyltetrahydromethanopterin cyclohydrolase [Mesorhizobium sp.]TIL40026.1 MAG: methenyltetrahydromethanopterin cyclohydrolase [Mesorhizobium sp.]